MDVTKLTACPYCGQALANRGAVERLRETMADQERELQKRIEAKASSLADDMVAERRAELEKELARANDKRIKELENTLKRVQNENLELERRVQKLSAHERGDSQEVDVYGQLVDAFPGDEIERCGKGGDILHTVHCDAGRAQERAGIIVYECKDTIRWENAFITQIRKAGAAQRTPYLILVTRACPKGEKAICVRDEVIVVQPAYVCAMAAIVRKMVIQAHRAGLTAERRDEKTARLFEYLTSDGFRQTFAAIVGASDDMRHLLSEEKRTHERVWIRREQAYDNLARRSSAVDEAIRAIIEESPRRDAKVLHLPVRAKAI